MDIGNGKLEVKVGAEFVEVTGLTVIAIPEKDYAIIERGPTFNDNATRQDTTSYQWTEGRIEGVLDEDDTSADTIVSGAIFTHEEIKIYPNRDSVTHWKPADGALIKFPSVHKLEITKNETRKISGTYIVVDGDLEEVTS